MTFPISYRIAELVREHISTPYVRASDTEVSRALGLSRNALHEYKIGKSRMSAETAARALELLGSAGHEATALFQELCEEHQPNPAQGAIWRLLESAAASRAASWIVVGAVAMLAGGTLLAGSDSSAVLAGFLFAPFMNYAPLVLVLLAGAALTLRALSHRAMACGCTLKSTFNQQGVHHACCHRHLACSAGRVRVYARAGRAECGHRALRVVHGSDPSILWPFPIWLSGSPPQSGRDLQRSYAGQVARTSRALGGAR